MVGVGIGVESVVRKKKWESAAERIYRLGKLRRRVTKKRTSCRQTCPGGFHIVYIGFRERVASD
jgi:hypothetical protein